VFITAVPITFAATITYYKAVREGCVYSIITAKAKENNGGWREKFMRRECPVLFSKVNVGDLLINTPNESLWSYVTINLRYFDQFSVNWMNVVNVVNVANRMFRKKSIDAVPISKFAPHVRPTSIRAGSGSVPLGEQHSPAWRAAVLAVICAKPAGGSCCCAHRNCWEVRNLAFAGSDS